MRVRAIGLTSAPKETFPRVLPQSNFPLTTMVLNVTNKCNLACTYCYEYGEDKIVDTTCDPAPNYMRARRQRSGIRGIWSSLRGERGARWVAGLASC